MWWVPVYTAAVALYMVAQFVETASVHYAMGAAALSAFIVSAFFARGVYQVSGALFFAFGVGLFCFGWALLVRRVKRYAVMALCHWKERTEGLGNYFFMFLGAGLFVEMLARSPLLAGLGGWFRVGAEHSVWLYGMIAVYFFATSFVGFHPLVSLTLLMPLLEPVRLLVPAVPLSIVLICCSLATVMYSPYNISVSLLAEELGDNPYRIGRRNVPFALGYMAGGIGIALLAERLFFG
ncbi:hypothetical protein [Geobacillus stearothermophilus]|uniref:hypothetical protein n=1 Tax=Geobacillus stearothermophilus TaxID=1422 RepID=UPI003D205C50